MEAAINRGADNQQNRLWYSVAADALQRAGVKTAAQAVDRLRRELVRQRQYDHELRRVDTAITRSILEALLIARLARFKRMDALVAPTIATLCRPQDCGAVVHLPAAAARHVMFGG
ncbi:hypothetical protein CH340_21190 [Rhodoplanes serenus]|nr:hypothetical protein CH340_21190 [Rhodoplanes serenus]